MTRTIEHRSAFEPFEITRTAEKREILYRGRDGEEAFFRNVWVDAQGAKFVMAKGKWHKVGETPDMYGYSLVLA